MGSNLGEQEAKWDHGRFSPIGERSTLATVTWKNLRPDGSLARQWRQSYNVVRLADGDDISPQRCGGAVTLACGTFLTCGRVLTMSVHKGKADFRVRALCGPEMTVKTPSMV